MRPAAFLQAPVSLTRQGRVCPAPAYIQNSRPGFPQTRAALLIKYAYAFVDSLAVLRGSSQLPQAEHGGAGRGQRVRVVQALHVREGAQQTAGTKVVVLGGGQLLAQGSRTDRQLGAQHVGVLAALQLG